MKRADLTEKILDIKREKGWSWKHICDAIGGMSPMLNVSARSSPRTTGSRLTSPAVCPSQL